MPSTLLNEDYSNYSEDNESFVDLSNITPDIMKNGPSIPYAEKMKLEKAASADKKWTKIETKTDRLIEKSEKKSAKLYRTSIELGSHTDRITLAICASFKTGPSKLDYLYLMGNPLIVLNYVISNLNENGFIDTSTDEIAQDLSLQEHTVKNVVSKLASRGFLNCRSNPGSKRRILVVNPSILSL